MAKIVQGERRDKFIWLCRAAAYRNRDLFAVKNSARRAQRQIYSAMPSRSLSKPRLVRGKEQCKASAETNLFGYVEPQPAGTMHNVQCTMQNSQLIISLRGFDSPICHSERSEESIIRANFVNEEKGKRFRRRSCSAFRTVRAEAGGASVASLRRAGIRLARLNKIQTAFGFVFGLFDFGYAQDTFASGMLK